jgi:hypothetical protein
MLNNPHPTGDTIIEFEANDDNLEEQQQDGSPVKHDLAWARDPEESFSDWTIRVIRKAEEDTKDENDTVATSDAPAFPTTSSSCRDFRVHRVYLASGPRKSDYFKTLFFTQAATIERVNQTTELTLPETACSAFEQFLDFVYGGEECLTMNTTSVVALHYLADYLQVPPLHTLTYDYIQDHLMGSNVHIYCREGLLYGVEWVVEECIQVAAFSPKDLLPVLEEVQDAVLSPAASLSSTSFSPTSAAASDSTTVTSERAVQQVMAMLPPTKQVRLLQLSLSKSLQELKQFKRVPSRWKENIKDVRATHMPTLINSSMHYPLQGSGLEFPGRVCPLFYFDHQPEAVQQQQEQQQQPQQQQQENGHHRPSSRILARRHRVEHMHFVFPNDNSGFASEQLPLEGVRDPNEREVRRRSNSLAEEEDDDDVGNNNNTFSE